MTGEDFSVHSFHYCVKLSGDDEPLYCSTCAEYIGMMNAQDEHDRTGGSQQENE